MDVQKKVVVVEARILAVNDFLSTRDLNIEKNEKI